MAQLSRRHLLRAAASSTALLATSSLQHALGSAARAGSAVDSLPMQLYTSLSDEQKQKICLPADHVKRQFISNWWYIHQEHRINNTFNADQQDLIQQIFDSLHHADYRAAVNKQVEIDQYGKPKNAPAVGFFGTPNDEDFEFIFTGHHVTRRCNAHTNDGKGFGGAPIFYGHFPDTFKETKDHPGNPYWYQGKIFNQFVETLNDKQQQAGLVAGGRPRSEESAAVLNRNQPGWPGLNCSDLSGDQKEMLAETMRRMLVMFREDDVDATMSTIKQKNIIDRLHVSWYDGKYDIGSDQVWDTWQIEGPDMVWYFRGQPHIHSYFHVKS